MNSKTPLTQPAKQEDIKPASFDYKDWREYFIISTLRITSVVGIAIIAISFSTASVTDRILFLSLYLVLLVITLSNTSYTIRAFLLLFIIFTVGVNSILAWGPWLDGSIFFMAFITMSALLFDEHIDVITLLISIFTFAVVGTLQQMGIHKFLADGVPATTPIDWISYTINFSTLSIILIVAINQFKKKFTQVFQDIQNTLKTLATERDQLENKVLERTLDLEARAMQLRSAAIISRTVAELQNISELMESTTKLTAEQFGYYHTGLYLLDKQKKTAFLQASSSDDAKELIGQGFRIEPDRRNIINLAIQTKNPQITSDADKASFISDTNFPLTRSRMVLPLTVRNNVIGILDIHSEQPQAFNAQDAEILQTLADLVAISIDNVDLINETKNLVQQLEASKSNQIHEIWTKFTSRRQPAYQYTPAGVRPIFSNNAQQSEDGLRVPLILHGQNIGNITLKRKNSTVIWSERERILVEKVASQVALALENNRLVDETQKNALRDQVIANISARIRKNLDVESVLRIATSELRQALDLKEAEISIGGSQTENNIFRKNTDTF